MKRLLAILTIVGLMLVPQVTSAASPFKTACETPGASESTACRSAGGTTASPLTGPDGVLIKVTRIIAVIAGIAAVIVLIIAGIQFVTANGDSNSVSGARNTIIYTVVGLVVIVLAQAIITFIIGRL